MRGLWVGAVLVACGGPPGDVVDDTDLPVDSDPPVDSDAPDPCARPADVQIGEGEITFREVEPGGDFFLVHGPQGGWHVPVALRMRGVSEFIRLTVDVFDGLSGARMALTGEPLSRNVRVVKDDPLAPWACEGTLSGNDYILDLAGPDGDTDTPLSEELCGHPVDITVSVLSDLDEPLGTAELSVTLQPDPVEDGPRCAE